MILSKVNPSINIVSVPQEYSRIIFFCLQNLQTHLHSPYKLWQYLYQLWDDKDWRNIFTLIELCMCSPCSNAALERFFSQMRVVKTNWRNRLNEENLTHLLRIKVAGPPLREFHDTYCDLAVSSWYNDKHRRMGQTQQKKYRKKKSNRPTRKEFDLPSLFETSSESENEDP